MYQVLLITMIVAIVLALIIGILTWWKINQFRKQSIKKNFTPSHQKVWENPRVGELLWELKKQTKNPLQDEQLIYAINTVFRNNYQTSCVRGFSSFYETQNLYQIAQQNISCDDFDFFLVNFDQEIVNQLASHLKLLNDKGIILITNAPRSGKDYAQISDFCHQYKLRFNYEWVGKGIIVIAK